MKKQIKQISALAAVILWVMLIITTVVVSFIDTETCNTLFRGLIFTYIILPVVVYAMILVYKILSGKNTGSK